MHIYHITFSLYSYYDCLCIHAFQFYKEKPDDRDSGYVEPNIANLIGNVARMSMAVDRQMSIDATVFTKI